MDKNQNNPLGLPWRATEDRMVGIEDCEGYAPRSSFGKRRDFIIAASEAAFAINPADPIGAMKALPELVEAVQKSYEGFTVDSKSSDGFNRIIRAIAAVTAKPWTMPEFKIGAVYQDKFDRLYLSVNTISGPTLVGFASCFANAWPNETVAEKLGFVIIADSLAEYYDKERDK